MQAMVQNSDRDRAYTATRAGNQAAPSMQGCVKGRNIMHTKDAEKIVAAAATAGALFIGLVVFRVAKGLVLLGQLARREKQEPGRAESARHEGRS